MTGATGFIGTHLCHALATIGAEVHAITRTQGTYSLPGLTWHQVDLTSAEATEACLSRVRAEIVFELCSHAQGERDLALVAATFRGELLSTINVLTALAKVGCARAVLAGSMEEPRPGEAPVSPYAAAKAASRLYVDLFHREYKVPVVMPRIFMTYGPGQSAKKFVAYCTRAMLAGEAVHIRTPHRSTDWIFVHDVVDGLIRTAVAPGIEGRLLDIGTGRLTTLHDIARTLRDLTCSTSDIHADAAAAAGDAIGRAADVDTARACIGWTAATPLVNGLTETVRHELGRLNQESMDGKSAAAVGTRAKKSPTRSAPRLARPAMILGSLIPLLTDPLLPLVLSV